MRHKFKPTYEIKSTDEKFFFKSLHYDSVLLLFIKKNIF